MSYPRQPSTVMALQKIINRSLRRRTDVKARILDDIWARTRSDMAASIRFSYRLAAGEGRWTFPGLMSSGAFSYLQMRVRSALLRFHSQTSVEIRDAIKDLKAASALMHAWLLDQVTPESVRVGLPSYAAKREAGVRRMSQTEWNERWSHWIDSYHSALLSNLKMGAINESSVEDAEGEVDATRVNTPASSLKDAMQRLFDWEAAVAVAAGEDDVMLLNGDLVDTKIWKTMGDTLVDADCADNEGLTRDEVEWDIPLHPNCRCFWVAVPKSYAKLLRSGDDADRALARDMQARGIVPTALLVRGKDGGIAAKVIVDFKEWVGGNEKILRMGA